MADYSQTVNNSINCFGVAPTNLWGAYNWAAFLWGEGTTGLETLVTKVIDNALSSLDSSVTAQGFHNVTVENELTCTADMYYEALRDSAGYYYLFSDNTTDAEGRDFPTWTSATAASTTWTAATAASTTWS